jgi:hypothetical protein
MKGSLEGKGQEGWEECRGKEEGAYDLNEVSALQTGTAGM